MPFRTTPRFALALLTVVLLLPGAGVLAAQAAAQPGSQLPQQAEERPPASEHVLHPLHEIDDAMMRLPLAAILGAALALRPRRRGTPPRSPAVVQTQIVLAVVGAVVMLVVGASLARAFGIVGAANLVRYRSKIEDPKDAAVMLCALSVGLAAGVGLYALSIFSTVFMVVALGIIESFEPQSSKTFLLKLKAEQDTDGKRNDFERILQNNKLPFELRTASDDELSYEVSVPIEVQTDDISNQLLRLDPGGHLAVVWEEKKNKK